MLKEIKNAEIIIGIVGAVGTDLKSTINLIKNELKLMDYKPEVISLSSAITVIDKYKDVKKIKGDEEKRISSLMDACDSLRESINDGAAMAYLGIGAIREFRYQKTGEYDKPIERQAYVLDSIKRPDEVDILKKIYGNSFILFSIYSPRDARIKFLSNKLCKIKKDTNPSKYEQSAQNLVNRDDKSGHKDFGQDVQEAFPLGDIFIRDGASEEIRKQVKRFIELWFGHPFTTPTIDEYGMYFANAVAKRSADLSRQVGAAILSKDGDILTVGCNEVPKFGGGIAWCGDELDFRDFVVGRDRNVNIKDEIVKEIFCELKTAGWLSDEFKEKDPFDIAREALYSGSKILKETRLSSLLEFGRVVHAEMNALMDAAKRGISVKGATLYCTTFPCHICARHIISAGIDRVVFIEPYPKSMTEELYQDIVSVDERGRSPNKLRYDSFVGVSPNKYIQIYQRGKRKDEIGYADTWEEIEKYPRVGLFREAYFDLEKVVVDDIVDAIEQLK